MRRIASLHNRAGLFFLASAMVLASCGNNADNNVTTDSTTMNMGNDTAMGMGNVADTAIGAHAVAVISGTKQDTAVDGTILFDQQQDGKILMKLKLNVPSNANKSVAVHIHEHGNCGDMGNHAGGHWNPTNTQHGKWGSGSFHSGDIGNIDLNGQGVGEKTLETDLWTIGGNAQTNILNKTIIVHSGVDDYESQPSGNSGSRIGCGTITRGGDKQ